MAKKKAKPAAKSAAKKAKPVAKSKTAKAKPKAKVVSLKGKTAKKAVKALKKAVSKAPTKTKKALGKTAKAVAKTAPKSVAKTTAKAGNVVPFARPAKKAGALSGLFSPLEDRVIVELAGVADRTPGGLYIPDSVENSDRHQKGTIVAVGPGLRDKKGRLHPLDVQVGDEVLFETYMGSELSFGDRKVFVLRESALLGVVKA